MSDQPNVPNWPSEPVPHAMNPRHAVNQVDAPSRQSFLPQGQLVITRVNWLGLKTLYMKEVKRFFKVHTQTIWAPALTTLLFLVIFTVALGRSDRLILGVNFATFIAPGLIVMGMMQNAFANASFSLLSGKIQGTIVDFLMPPLSEGELMAGMILASVTRAVLVGVVISAAMLAWPGVDLPVAHVWAIVWFGLMGSVFLSQLGFLSSIWADKYDHNAAVSNFVIAPLSLLSGTFYLIDNLAPAFQLFSRLNPFFYIISGFRYGFLGDSDIGSGDLAVIYSAAGLAIMNIAFWVLIYFVLRSGWKLKS